MFRRACVFHVKREDDIPFCVPRIFFIRNSSSIWRRGGKEDKNSNGGGWEFDVGGQVRLRGYFAENQNFTDFSFTPDHKEGQFLEAFSKYKSKSTGCFNEKY